MHVHGRVAHVIGRPRPIIAVALMFLATACGVPSSASASYNCTTLGQATYLARARLAMVGTMLSGPTAMVGGQSVLVSPARMRVTWYLKGHGPRVVKVQTRVQNGNVVKRRGIEPQAGQQWVIFTQSRHLPYWTTICAGSRHA